MQAELCVRMPASHYKHKIQDGLIVWGGEKAV